MKSAKMNPVFSTKRLRVFMAKIVPDPASHHLESDFFFVCRTDIDCPMVVVSATCLRLSGQTVLQGIQINDLHRRLGLATELWRGIEQYYGEDIDGDPVSESGEAFYRCFYLREHEKARKDGA